MSEVRAERERIAGAMRKSAQYWRQEARRIERGNTLGSHVNDVKADLLELWADGIEKGGSLG